MDNHKHTYIKFEQTKRKLHLTKGLEITPLCGSPVHPGTFISLLFDYNDEYDSNLCENCKRLDRGNTVGISGEKWKYNAFDIDLRIIKMFKQ